MQGDAGPADLRLTRWVYLRCLGLVFFIAFLSLSVQIHGLVGENGILPAGRMLAAVWEYYQGFWAYWNVPTLGWFASGNAALTGYCYTGVGVSMLLICGIAPRVSLAACWVLYLSLYHLGQDFLGFQWDILLLEASLLSIFLAPNVMVENPFRDPPVPRVWLWVLRLLLWKLMFFSGYVKLPDPTWTKLEALAFHFETQPLPHALSWYAHQFPDWLKWISVALMFLIELVCPFFLFGPRRLRIAGAACFAWLMALIALTGNYTFFNVLTLALCLLWLDDAALLRRMPARLREKLRARRETPIVESWRVYPALVVAGLWCFLLGIQTVALVRGPGYIGHDLYAVLRTVQPWSVCNSYGLFRTMTVERNEIVLQGSNDGVEWKSYGFRYKPVDPRDAPRWCQPHQPRLDWQMWFAALSNAQSTRWFQSLVLQLLQGSDEVNALFESVPFPDAPPKYVRALFYQYRFTSWEEGQKHGDWWTREQKGLYLQPVSLAGP